MRKGENKTGTAIHIEKVRGSSKTRRTCFNCKYHNDGGWCREKKIQCYENHAGKCGSYINMMDNDDSVEELRETIIKNNNIDYLLSDTYQQERLKQMPTIIVVTITNNMLKRIKETIERGKEYYFIGNVKSNKYLYTKITDVFICSDGNISKVLCKKINVILKPHATVSFNIYRINLHEKFKKNKYCVLFSSSKEFNIQILCSKRNKSRYL